MADTKMEFDIWLSNKLQLLNLDEDMFLDYLKSVLADEDSSEEDKKDGLCGIISGAIEGQVEDHCDEILKKWQNSKQSVSDGSKDCDMANDSSTDIIRSIIEKQQSTVAPLKVNKSDSIVEKNALLAKYAHVSDEEDMYESDDNNKKSSNLMKDNSVFKNVNAKSVADKQRAEREKQKKEHDEKKVRDKQNREAEKLKRQERQEKEKKRTQKGEKRR